MKTGNEIQVRSTRARAGVLAFGCLFFSLLPQIPLPAFGSPTPDQLPTGGDVTSGQATIVSNGPRMDVNQSTQKATINWSTFDVGANAHVNFNQPSSTSQTLNRVISGEASQIYGKITANGEVFLVNPNGVIFGPGSQVSGASVVASTLDLSDENFKNGTYTFERNGASGAITNQGTISAKDGGYVALFGIKVKNQGAINAPSGKVVLAAGDKVRVPLTDSGLITIDAASSGSDAEVANEAGATISADQFHVSAAGGKVSLKAGSLAEAKTISVSADNVEIGGTLTVDSALAQGGVIKVSGRKSVIQSSTGKISANGKSGGSISLSAAEGATQLFGAVRADGSGSSGGSIDVLGNTVMLGSTAIVSTNGATAGGTIHIGGAFHGAGDTQRALTTFVENGAFISANAGAGNGGSIAVWSDAYTRFLGSIEAQGGATSGDGGSVEVSGKKVLDFYGAVNLLAPKGTAGTLLLDPENVTISSSSDYNASCSGGACTPSGDDSIINVTTLQNALALSNVTVTTGSSGSQQGDIVVASNITWATKNLLLLAAAGNITINSGVTISNTYSGTFGSTAIPVVLALRADALGAVNGSGVSTNTFGVSYSGATISMSASTGAVSIFNDKGCTSCTAGTNTNKSGWTAPSNSTVNTQFKTYTLINGIGDLTGMTLSSTYGMGTTIDGGGGVFNGNVPIGTLTGILDGQYCALAGGATCGIVNFTLTSATQAVLSPIYTVSGIARNLTIDVDVTNTYSQGNYTAGFTALINNSGTVANVSGSGRVEYSGTYTTVYLGGLIGSVLSGTLAQSSFSGDVVYTTSSSASVTAFIGGTVGASSSNSVKTSSASGTVQASCTTCAGSHYIYLGGFIGKAAGNVANSFSTASVTNGTTSNGLLGTMYVGGLAGSLEGSTCTSCYSTGAVKYSGGGTNIYMGGLVGGTTNGTIFTQSYATGSVDYTDYRTNSVVGCFGGLVGYHFTIGASTANSVVNSWASGDVSARCSDSSHCTGNISIGGLIGRNSNTSATSIVDSHATGNVYSEVGAITSSVAIGGLVGQSPSGGIIGNTGMSYATGSVTYTGLCLTVNEGGLLGYGTTPPITKAYSTGDVIYNNTNTSAATTAYVGGLLGYMGGTATVSQAWASGSVLAQYANGGNAAMTVANVGGLLGQSGIGGTTVISLSYASGSVTNSLNGGNQYTGGLVGNINSTSATSITNSYATGAVTYAGSSGTNIYTGGLAGNNASTGTVSYSYATGFVVANAGTAGGLLGANASGTVTSSYWDTDTSGQATSAGGTGMATSSLKGALPTGFSAATWGYLTEPVHTYPYLLWRFGASPDIVYGTIYADQSNALSARTAVKSLTGSAYGGSGTSDLDGAYYILLPSGTLSSSRLLVYVSGGQAGTFYESVSGSVSGANVYTNELRAVTSDSALSTLTSNLGTSLAALGTSALTDFSISSGNLTLASTGSFEAYSTSASFDIDRSITASGSGVVTLRSANAITQSAGITATNLLLLGGGTFTLDNGANSIGTLAGSVGTVTLADAAASLTVGSLSGITGLTATGAATLSADAMVFSSALAITGQLTLKPFTAAKSMTISDSGDISTASLENVSAGSLALGSASAGDLVIDTSHDFGAVSLSLISGAGIAPTALTATGGTVVFESSVTLAANSAIAAHSITFDSTVNGAYDLSANAASITMNGTWGGLTPLGSVSLVATGDSLVLPSMSASNLLIRSNDLITLPSGVTLTASVSGNAIRLVAPGGFINQSDTPFSMTGGGRWLLYTPGASSNTLGSLTPDFTMDDCSYTSCPGLPDTGNGVLYGFSGTLTVTPVALTALVYGSDVPSLVGYTYTISGYQGSDGDTDVISGSLTGSTTYTQGANVGTYSISYLSGLLTSSLGYSFLYATNPSGITVSQKTLNVSLLNNISKTYNGTATASLSSANFGLSGIYGTDDISVTSISGTYGSIHAGTGISVSVEGITLTGAKASNYALDTTSLSEAVGTITTREATVTADSKSATYGSTLGSLTYTSTGLINGDVFSGELLTSGSGAGTVLSHANGFDVASSPYAITQGTLSNSDYDITFIGANLTLSKKAIAVSAITKGVTYGDTVPTLTYSAPGLVAGDTLSGELTTAHGGAGTALTSANGFSATSYQITQGTLTDPNYTITYNYAWMNVGKRAVSITGFDASDKVYDGTTAATITSYGTLTNAVSGDDVSIGTSSAVGTFSNKAAGTRTVSGSGFTLSGAQALNYSLSGQPSEANVTISPRLLTITANAVEATYGDTLGTLTYSAPDLVSGDTLSGTLTTAGGGAGTVLKHSNGFDATASPYAITIGTISTNSNYTITYVGANLTINPKTVTVSGFSVANKVYDGNTTSTISSYGMLSGGISGDDLVLNTTGAFGTFDDPQVGTTHTVSGWGFTLTGAQAGNYSIEQPSAYPVTIGIKSLTITADAISATYGDTLGTLTYTVEGLAEGDSLSGALTTTYGGAGTVLSHANGFDVTGSPFSILQGTLTNSNYAITYVGNSLTLSPKSVSITGFSVADKVYNGSLSATVSSHGSLSGKLADDIVSINHASAIATFDNKNVGTDHVVTGSGYALAGDQAANYVLDAQPTASSVTVSPRPLTVTAFDRSATYGSTLGELTYYAPDLVYGDTLSGGMTTAYGGAGTVLSHANGFDVSGGPYTISQGTLSNSNYEITFVSGDLTLTQRNVSVTGFSIADKVYDQTTTTTIESNGTLSNKVAGDDLTLDSSGASVAFDSPNAGTYSITASGYALSGAQAGNYNLSVQPTDASVKITARPMTVTVDAVSATYGDTLGALTYSVSELLDGDSLVGALTTTHGGAGTVLSHANGFDVSGSPFAILRGSLSNSNYAITYVGANLTLSAKSVSITGFQAASKVYDGTVNATIVSNGSLTGALFEDTVGINASGATASFDGKDVGTHVVTASGYTLSGAQAGNYILSEQPSENPVSIGSKALTITADAQSFVYGSAMGTLTYSVFGLEDGDSLSGALTTAFGGAATTLSHANGFDVGNTYAIAQGTLSNSNYVITYIGGNLTLTPKPVTVSGFSVLSKTYDGSVVATVSSAGTLAGKVSGDLLSLNSESSAATFDDKNAGTTHTVTASGYFLEGAQAGNYSLTQPAATNVSINQKPLTIWAESKSATYGTTLGELIYSATGLLEGDTLSGALTTANGGAGTLLSHANGFDVDAGPYAITLGTLSNSNYAFTYHGANLTLARKTLSLSGFDAADKTYDGSISATISSLGALSGALSEDNIVLDTSGVSATFDNRNIGTDHRVTASGYAILGALVGNYNFASQPMEIDVTISPKPLVITADAQNLAYGDTLGALTYSAPDLVSGDTLEGALTTAHGGEGTLISHANGFDASTTYAILRGTLSNDNYAITFVGADLTLAPKALTVTAQAKTATYGSVMSTLTYETDGLVFGDSLSGALTTANGGSGTVLSHANSFDVLSGPYAISQGTLSSPNYAITFVGSTLSLVPRPVIVSANATTATYGDILGALTYSVNDIVSGDTLSGTLTTTHGGAGTVLSHANGFDVLLGPYAISQGTLDNSNYNITYVGSNLTLTARPLSITGFAVADKSYDGNTDATITDYGVLSNTVSGDDIGLDSSSASAAFDTKSVGDAHIVTGSGFALSGGQGDNYSLSGQPMASSVTITPRAVTVTATAQTATYGDTLGTLTYTTLGLVPGESLSGTLTTAYGGAGTVLKHANNFDVGTYGILQGSLSNSDYTISYVGSNLTVEAKTLRVSARAQTAAYGSVLGPLTYSSSGLVSGDTLSGALSTAHGGSGTILNSANGFEMSGSPYAILQGTLANSNYAIAYFGANLILTQVNPAERGVSTFYPSMLGPYPQDRGGVIAPLAFASNPIAVAPTPPSILDQSAVNSIIGNNGISSYMHLPWILCLPGVPTLNSYCQM